MVLETVTVPRSKDAVTKLAVGIVMYAGQTLSHHFKIEGNFMTTVRSEILVSSPIQNIFPAGTFRSADSCPIQKIPGLTWACVFGNSTMSKIVSVAPGKEMGLISEQLRWFRCFFDKLF